MSQATTNPFHQWIQLEQPRLGTEVVHATDDFFADKSRLIQSSSPVFVPDKYDDNGKWMDGWESRRKRVEGHDHCTVRLGVPGRLRGVDIDTSHFTGNFPPGASLDVCRSAALIPDEDEWRELLPRIDLQGDAHHFHALSDAGVITHVRLHIYPDGGVARLRLYGEVSPDWERVDGDDLDLFALENGGRALLCNDEHFGSMHNLNLPGRGINMGDGWETARRRVPGNDWVIIALGSAGKVTQVEIDTAHFKGNYPDGVRLQGAKVEQVDLAVLERESESWPDLLPRQKLSMDKQHYFDDEVNAVGVITHVRMSIYPDGGISRLRLRGMRVA